MKVFVTGANGFVGQHLVEALVSRGHQVTSAVRLPHTAPEGSTELIIGSIGPDSNWSHLLVGHDAVIHLAARVHVMTESSADPKSEFLKVNSEGTRRLAAAAAEQGVRRFVFLSSIKVNGEATENRPVKASDTPQPIDPYGLSKYSAELGIREVEASTELEVVIIRTPLVYGPGVGGNFLRTLWLAATGLPLPLGSVKNRRTMCSVWNLTDILERGATETSAAGALVLAGDAQSPSTPELVSRVRSVMGKRPNIVPFPVHFLKLAGRLAGRSGEISRLTESLEVVSGSCSTGWEWKPPFAFDESIERTVDWYAEARRGEL